MKVSTAMANESTRLLAAGGDASLHPFNEVTETWDIARVLFPSSLSFLSFFLSSIDY